MSKLTFWLQEEMILRDLRRVDEYDNQGTVGFCSPGVTQEDCRQCPARPEDHPEGTREVCLWQRSPQ